MNRLRREFTVNRFASAEIRLMRTVGLLSLIFFEVLLARESLGTRFGLRFAVWSAAALPGAFGMLALLGLDCGRFT